MVQVSWRWFRFRPASFSWLAWLSGSRAHPGVAASPPADVSPASVTAARPAEPMPLRARPALHTDAGTYLRYPLGASPRPGLSMHADAHVAPFRKPSEDARRSAIDEARH